MSSKKDNLLTKSSLFIKSFYSISIILSIVGLVLTVTIFDFTSFINLEAFSDDVVNIAELYLLPL